MLVLHVFVCFRYLLNIQWNLDFDGRLDVWPPSWRKCQIATISSCRTSYLFVAIAVQSWSTYSALLGVEHKILPCFLLIIVFCCLIRRLLWYILLRVGVSGSSVLENFHPAKILSMDAGLWRPEFFSCRSLWDKITVFSFTCGVIQIFF